MTKELNELFFLKNIIRKLIYYIDRSDIIEASFKLIIKSFFNIFINKSKKRVFPR